MVNAFNLVDNEKILYDRLNELCYATKHKDKAHFSFFLNPREQIIASAATNGNCSLYGGYDEAERKMVGIFPDNVTENMFPLSAIKIVHKKNLILSHKDVLGSIIGLGISRSSIGDILPTKSYCTVICTDIVAPVIIDELNRVGREGVSSTETTLLGIKSVREYEKISGTVSSLRLDSIVALLAKCSRSKALELIVSGNVQHNYIVEERPAIVLDIGDVITIRRHGKFIIDITGNPTRKGRTPLECRKYI